MSTKEGRMGEKERRGREGGVRRKAEKQIGGLLRKQWCGSWLRQYLMVSCRSLRWL